MLHRSYEPGQRPNSAADYGWLLTLFVVTVVVLMATDDMGYTRDESFYFYAGEAYVGWFVELVENLRSGHLGASFTQANIDAHWSYNPEHPVLMKALFGISWQVFAQQLGWMSNGLAMRFPAMLFSAGLVALTWQWARDITGDRVAAAIAAVSLIAMPRVFFHAHLTCFDMPMTTLWVGVMYAYWRSLRSTRWAWITGALWGLALITKLNAFFLPVVMLAHQALLIAPRVRVDAAWRLRVPPLPAALFTMTLLGPIIFYLGWPRHWFDTLSRIGWYVNFHMQHEHYFVRYFGQDLVRPPFPVAFPFVMTLTTTPLPIMAAWAVGLGVGAIDAWRGFVARRGAALRDALPPTGTVLLFALNIVIPMLIISRPSTPVFGGIKHWFAALPFLSIFAAIAIHEITTITAKRTQQRALAFALAATILAPTLVATAISHPYGTAYYNSVVGGYTGAADRLAMRQFWGYAARGSLDFLNRSLPQNSQVYFHNSTPWAYKMYRDDAQVRPDIRSTMSMETADYTTFHHQHSFAWVAERLFTAYETRAPIQTAGVNGVPMVSVYKNASREQARTRGARRDRAAQRTRRREEHAPAAPPAPDAAQMLAQPPIAEPSDDAIPSPEIPREP